MSDRDNAVRHPDAPGQGHVESHFLKANSPDGTRAIWIKHTAFVPRTPSGAPAVAEVWAVAFADGGRKKQARKQTFPLSALQVQAAPFRLRLPGAELSNDRAVGSLDGLAWELVYASRAPSFRPFPLEAMYRGPFPRSKSLTPSPDARMSGWFEAFGERWQLDGWRGAQGHNWGPSHAHAYAWVHANVLSDQPEGPPIEGAWVEALTGRTRLGRMITPWLSVAGLALDGRVHRFAGPRAIFSRQVAVSTRAYRFELAGPGARLRGEFSADSQQFVGLRYQDPDGSMLACLNSKLARGTLVLEAQGRQRVLYTQQAALELGTRAADHGVELQDL